MREGRLLSAGAGSLTFEFSDVARTRIFASVNIFSVSRGPLAHPRRRYEDAGGSAFFGLLSSTRSAEKRASATCLFHRGADIADNGFDPCAILALAHHADQWLGAGFADHQAAGLSKLVFTRLDRGFDASLA